MRFLPSQTNDKHQSSPNYRDYLNSKKIAKELRYHGKTSDWETRVGMYPQRSLKQFYIQ